MSLLLRDVLHGDATTHIYIEGDRIVALGEAREADSVIDGRGKAVLPGLVNAHTHAAMTLMRGFSDDLPLMEWLNGHIWPLERGLRAEHVYHGTRLAALEMIRSGTTLFCDMYYHPREAARATESLGLRAVLGLPLIDFLLGRHDDPEGWILDELTALEGQGSERRAPEGQASDGRVPEGRALMTPALSPHAVYTVGTTRWEWVARTAAERGLLVHTHLAETAHEVAECRAAHGASPTAYLDRLGVLGPHVVAAHGVHLDDDDIALLAARGVNIVHCPASNHKLAVGGAFRYRALRSAVVNVALGTDGPASSNNLDLFQAMRLASLAEKRRQGDPTALPVREALALASANGYAALGLPEGGRIAVGALADLILMDLQRPEMVPNHCYLSNAVYSASGAVVDTTIIAGKVVMERGVVPGEAQILADAQAAAEDLVARWEGAKKA